MMKNVVMKILGMVLVLSMTSVSWATVVFDSDFETGWDGWSPGGNIHPVRTTDAAFAGDYSVKYNVSNAGIKSYISRGISGSPGEYWFRFMYQLDQAAYTSTGRALNLLDFRPSGAGPLWRLKFSGTSTGLSNAYLNITPESAQLSDATNTTPLTTSISANDWVGDGLWHQIIIHAVHDTAANGGGVWMWVDPAGTNPSATVWRSDNWTANNPLGTIYVGDVSSLSNVQIAYVDRTAFGDANESLSSMLVPEPATIGLLTLGFGFWTRRRR